jgi:hypothetical protein
VRLLIIFIRQKTTHCTSDRMICIGCELGGQCESADRTLGLNAPTNGIL